MDYEKKYKEALAHAREIHRNEKEKRRDMEFIFPELKESEDERIRKEFCKDIWTFIPNEKAHKYITWLEKQGEKKNKVNSYKITFEDVLVLECAMKTVKITKGGNELYEKIIPLYNKIHNAYLLEKQGKQEDSFDDFKAKDWYVSKDGKIRNIYHSVDMVEPKFKIGDWITCEELNTAKIVNIDSDRYEIEFIDGYKGFPHIDYVDRLFHLWSIKDAKNGDVLTSELCGTIMLYEGIRDNNVQFYCDYDLSDYYISGDRFAINDGQQHYGSVDDSDDWHPATKEQCDTFFKAMHEAGYEWDSEKKKLKLLITNGDDFESENCEQNHDWSEEDEEVFNQTLKTACAYGTTKMIDWLKSIKQRIIG